MKHAVLLDEEGNSGFKLFAYLIGFLYNTSLPLVPGFLSLIRVFSTAYGERHGVDGDSNIQLW